MLFCKFLLGLKVQYFLALPSHESTCRCGVWDDHVSSPAPPMAQRSRAAPGQLT